MKKGLILISFCIMSLSTIFSQSISVRTPKEGAILNAGRQVIISWFVNGQMDPYVKIRLCDSSGTKILAIITDNTPTKTKSLKLMNWKTRKSDGKFKWTIPVSLFKTEGEYTKKGMRKYTIRIKTKDNMVFATSKVFFIKPLIPKIPIR